MVARSKDNNSDFFIEMDPFARDNNKVCLDHQAQFISIWQFQVIQMVNDLVTSGLEGELPLSESKGPGCVVCSHYSHQFPSAAFSLFPKKTVKSFQLKKSVFLIWNMYKNVLLN